MEEDECPNRIHPLIPVSALQSPAGPVTLRGSVSTFCAEHDIARSTFYALRARAVEEGRAEHAIPEPRIKHVGFIRYNRTTKPEVVHDVLRHGVSPMS